MIMTSFYNATNQSSTPLCNLFKSQKAQDVSPDVYNGLSVFLAITNIITALLTIVGNTVIFVAFYKVKSLRTPSNLLLLSLSFSDFLAGIFTEPFHATEIILAINQPRMACTAKDFYSIAMFLTTVASVVSICFISLERYLAVFYPNTHRLWVTRSRVCKAILAFWAVWILVTGLTHTKHGIGTWGYSCFGTIGLCVPVILFVNFKLFKESRKHAVAINSHSVAVGEIQKLKASKSVKVVLLIVALSLLCNLPILAIFLARKFGQWKGKLSTLIWLQSNTFSLISSCLDPFLYFWRTRDVHEAVVKVLELKTKHDIDKQ